ncbi:uncharacterized protein LOC121779111 [Salvia splendens]|uniref:uncharacterized protein LOC121779111 n=1 Tax=Salvia splendens TaxID=180675 RepID=UPI001C260313|nr:uncharacterized protein LOC121779111 [Salvia splendens]
MPDKENISLITLRSGKEYSGPSQKAIKDRYRLNQANSGSIGRDEIFMEDLRRPLPQMAEPLFLESEDEEIVVEKSEEMKEATKEVPIDPIKLAKPFPYRVEAKKKREDPVDFMEIFEKLEINLPFLQALKLPPFSRFIKDFIARKAKADGKIVIDENGASINVLPFSVYKRLSGARPEGVLENVIVKVHEFLYPADFHVIQMTESESAEASGVLLGRPFLRMAKTIIDVCDDTICLDYHGEKFTLNIDEAMKKS